MANLLEPFHQLDIDTPCLHKACCLEPALWNGWFRWKLEVVERMHPRISEYVAPTINSFDEPHINNIYFDIMWTSDLIKLWFGDESQASCFSGLDV